MNFQLSHAGIIIERLYNRAEQVTFMQTDITIEY